MPVAASFHPSCMHLHLLSTSNTAHRQIEISISWFFWYPSSSVTYSSGHCLFGNAVVIYFQCMCNCKPVPFSSVSLVQHGLLVSFQNLSSCMLMLCELVVQAVVICCRRSRVQFRHLVMMRSSSLNTFALQSPSFAHIFAHIIIIITIIVQTFLVRCHRDTRLTYPNIVPNIVIQFAGYVTRMLPPKWCKFGFKICYISGEIELFPEDGLYWRTLHVVDAKLSLIVNMSFCRFFLFSAF